MIKYIELIKLKMDKEGNNIKKLTGALKQVRKQNEAIEEALRIEKTKKKKYKIDLAEAQSELQKVKEELEMERL